MLKKLIAVGLLLSVGTCTVLGLWLAAALMIVASAAYYYISCEILNGN